MQHHDQKTDTDILGGMA